MSDKEDQIRLSAGTVPDPFGLAREPARQLSDEEVPDPDGPGATAVQERERGEEADRPEVPNVRLGELD